MLARERANLHFIGLIVVVATISGLIEAHVA